MRSLLHALLVAMVVLLHGAVARAQPRAFLYSSDRPVTAPRTSEEELVSLQRDIARLQAELAAAQAGGQKDDEDLKKKVELLQKQIETQQKMIELLADHVRKQPLAGSPVEKLQTQAATLEARSRQAAQRDQDLAQAVDNISEHMDAEERNGPRLPYTLKGTFQDYEPDISPLVITGDMGLRFDKIGPRASNFSLQNFAPIILYQLRDNWLLSFEPEIGTDEIEVEYARLDWIVSDTLTIGFGRMLLPFGQFNERLRQKWISKLPMRPSVFLQVIPETLSQDGVQARGATYLANWPVKFEYAAWVTNGLSLNKAAPTPTDFANISAMRQTLTDVSDSKSVGGRAGLVLPECGIYTGVSYWFNPDYDKLHDDMHFWGLDFLWHWRSWDFRFEGVLADQQVPLAPTIRRRGFYVQAAYRDYDAHWVAAKNLEYVIEYGRTSFSGIPLATLDLAAFSDPRNAPVDRNELTFGINYYFSPSMLMQFAYQINSESHNLELKDNTFSSRLVWSF